MLLLGIMFLNPLHAKDTCTWVWLWQISVHFENEYQIAWPHSVITQNILYGRCGHATETEFQCELKFAVYKNKVSTVGLTQVYYPSGHQGYLCYYEHLACKGLNKATYEQYSYGFESSMIKS